MKHLAGSFLITLIVIIIITIGKGTILGFWQFFAFFFVMFFITFILMKISFFIFDALFPIVDDREKGDRR